MIERQDCLERVWSKPQFVKDVFTDCIPMFWGMAVMIRSFSMNVWGDM